MPQPAVWAGLTSEENSLILSKGESPSEYAAVSIPSAAIGKGFVDMQDDAGRPVRAVALQPLLAIPPSILPPDTSTLIDPATKQPRYSQRLQEAFPEGWPIVARVLVKRSALSKEMQQRLLGADEANAIKNGVGDAK